MAKTNKYYIARTSKCTRRIQFRMHKCDDDYWCDKTYLYLHPERVWKFSANGARKIIERYDDDWHYDYKLIPVE